MPISFSRLSSYAFNFRHGTSQPFLWVRHSPKICRNHRNVCVVVFCSLICNPTSLWKRSLPPSLSGGLITKDDLCRDCIQEASYCQARCENPRIFLPLMFHVKIKIVRRVSKPFSWQYKMACDSPFLKLQNLRNWFQVKSVWQKILGISGRV